MTDMTRKIVELIQEVRRIQADSEISFKQFEMAANDQNKEKMEAARVACHEFLDQLFDVKQRLSEMQDANVEEMLKNLYKK